MMLSDDQDIRKGDTMSILLGYALSKDLHQGGITLVIGWNGIDENHQVVRVKRGFHMGDCGLKYKQKRPYRLILLFEERLVDHLCCDCGDSHWIVV